MSDQTPPFQPAPQWKPAQPLQPSAPWQPAPPFQPANPFEPAKPADPRQAEIARLQALADAGKASSVDLMKLGLMTGRDARAEFNGGGGGGGPNRAA